MDDLSKWFERIHMDVIGPFMETKNAFPKFAVAKASSVFRVKGGVGSNSNPAYQEGFLKHLACSHLLCL
ncbi:Protein CBG26715 [Caenorhabditis briggsae]|uniref:Protein CBG26715 n=1 Tax=Caenorhabditis briggsae TaxID=6238 RepID=B6IE86_CAEBR|nr:Protein CBG26715 [Caenorhabditis briggsae]CAS01150.1 Protein CBG26715 [Caenorhabditis briggsae]